MSQGRFDSEAYLVAFRDRGLYPSIHDAIFDLILSRSRAKRFLDLCCSTGLLGERIKRLAGAEMVMGLDASKTALEYGAMCGVSIPTRTFKVEKSTLNSLKHLIQDTGVTAVVARRCLPEILGDDPDMDPLFASALADAGVEEVFIEGRVVQPRSTHRLRNIKREIDALSSRFHPVAKQSACCLLHPKEPNRG